MANLGLTKKKIMDLLAFQGEVCDRLLRANKAMPSEYNENRSISRNSPSPLPSTSVSYDKVAHWPIILDKKNASCCAFFICIQELKLE